MIIWFSNEGYKLRRIKNFVTILITEDIFIYKTMDSSRKLFYAIKYIYIF